MTIASEGGHWYDQDGQPVYEVTTLTGPNKGLPREVTIRDVRKLNLFPSVTGIIKEAAAPALTNYYVKQALLAGAAIPRDPLEGDQAWMDRVLARSKEHSETARDKGSLIHGCIERCLANERFTHAEYVEGALGALGDWCGLDEIASEKAFAHPLGYGGKCDIHKEGWVADFKTKDFTEGDLPKAWDNHAMQLAAYREGFNLNDARCAIIYVSTSVPGLTHLVEIPEADLKRGWEMFALLVKYWQVKKRYVPRTILTDKTKELGI